MGGWLEMGLSEQMSQNSQVEFFSKLIISAPDVGVCAKIQRSGLRAFAGVERGDETDAKLA
jgi:hypothetical protein